jgi:hypothetical protein
MAATTVPVRSPARSTGAVARPTRKRRRRIRDALAGHAYLIGAVLCFAFFSWYPAGRDDLGRLAELRADVARPELLRGMA